MQAWVTTRPRDIKIGPDRPRIVWRKRKWLCTNVLCKRKSFTESTPAIPARGAHDDAGQIGDGLSGARR
ncbi:hypothetical protein LRC484719_52770 [Mycobacterium riyadhense]